MIFTCTDHDGHYPVGVCSIVVANSETEARILLKVALHEAGLDENEPFTLQVIDATKPRATILLNGDY